MITLSEILALNMPLDDHGAVADALSVGRTKTVYTEIGNGTILAELGIAAGNQLLDAIYATPDFKYVVPLLEQGRLDISSSVTQGALDMLVLGGALAQADADKLKSLAQRPDPVSSQEVSKAMEGY